jgi:hypothetical protein
MTDGTDTDWQVLAAQAAEEAARFPLKPEHEPAVRDAIEAARRQLGGDSVDFHAVSFKPERWEPVLDALPPWCVAKGRISRGDIVGVARRGRDAEVLWELFVASYVWGQGNNGYGSYRLTRIVRSTPKDELAALIGDALRAGDKNGPMAAYAVLRGEHRYRGAVPHWGAAFFTKVLYFGLRDTLQPALILDRVMARRVTNLSGMPHLLSRGFGYNWTPHRYGAYLAWMRQTAQAYKVSPQLLEYALFTMQPLHRLGHHSADPLTHT